MSAELKPNFFLCEELQEIVFKAEGNFEGKACPKIQVRKIARLVGLTARAKRNNRWIRWLFMVIEKSLKAGKLR